MSGMQLNTDFSTIKPNEPGGSAFPVSDPKMGWLCKIIESGPKENSKKTGMLCVLKLEGMDQGIMGQTMDYSVNVSNPNQQAVDIGFAELSAIAHVVGVLRVGNTLELHGKPFRVLVRKQKEDDKYVEIYGVQDANGNAPGKAGQGPVASQPANQFGGGQQPQGNQGGGWNGQGANPQGGGNAGFTPGPQGGTAPQGGGNWNPNANPNPQGGGGNWNPNPNQGAPAQGGGQPGWSGGGAPQGGGNGQPAWAGNQGQ